MVEELTIFFFLSLLLTVIVFAPCKLGGSYILFWLVNFVTTATGIGAAPTSERPSRLSGRAVIWQHPGNSM